MTRKLLILMMFFPVCSGLRAQHVSDTSRAIREFEKVMSFATQPYLYYTSVTSLRYGPLVGGRDSAIMLRSRFYKVGDDLYYGNEVEETYLQDSLIVRVNHQRKTILLNRVDTNTKKNIDVMPLKQARLQKMFRKTYTISEQA